MCCGSVPASRTRWSGRCARPAAESWTRNRSSGPRPRPATLQVPQPAAPQAYAKRVVARLHREEDHRAFRPATQPEAVREHERMPASGGEPARGAGIVDEDRAEEAHQVRPAAVTNRLDLGVLVGAD